MKNFKKIMGIILVLCLVITQFPIIGSKISKASESEGTKTEVTSSKLSFTYEKTGEGEATFLKVCNAELNGFSGDGAYEADVAEEAWNTWDKTGYYNLGFISSDVAYTLKNVTLIVNGTYEFLLSETADSLYNEKEKVYKVDFPNMWNGQPEGTVLYTSKDGMATLVCGDGSTTISLNLLNGEGDSQKPDEVKTEITSSKLLFTYEKTGEGEATFLKVCNAELNGFSGDGAYEADVAEEAWNTWDKTGYYNLGFISSDVAYTLKNVTLIVNGTYEFLLSETADSLYNEKEKVYKVDFPNMWNGQPEGTVLYTSKDGKAILVCGDGSTTISLNVSNDDNQPENPDDGGNPPQNPDDGGNPPQNPDDGDDNQPEKPNDGDKPQETDKVKTEITSSKLSFTYEKTGEGEATFLRICNVELNGFSGDGAYEADVSEEAWSTWDKTGYYNLGFIESDAVYTLKNVTLTVNGVYEFVLGETFNSEEKEGVYKVDFPNIWGEAKEGDILYTSKDGKATLVSGGNNVVISLYILGDKDDNTQKPDDNDNQKPSDNDNQKPGGDDTQKPARVQVNIKSSKLSFTYEKTGETDATFLKVSGTDVNGFKGNGAYEIDIAESAWNTWDKTGYYNLGFVSSDAAYTLKNVVVTVNNTYEFVLEEIKAASYNEEEKVYKIDFINMWSGHKEGDVLYTSKDGKAALVSGGNTAVISLMVDKDAAPTLKPFLPPYAVSSPTTAPVTTAAPTVTPTTAPTVAPTANPTTVPIAPTAVPAVAPTIVPTAAPVATVAPTKEPVTTPSAEPEEPSNKPDGTNDIQKGDKVNVSGQKYEVTNNSKKTVAYVAAKNSKKSVSVPAIVKVKVDGKKVTYKVTSIKDKAFKGNKKIKTITVSKNITVIGKDAFKNCGKLKTIVIKSTNITKVGKDALKGTAKNLVIKVPAGKVSAYKKLFKNKGNNSIIIKKV